MTRKPIFLLLVLILASCLLRCEREKVTSDAEKFRGRWKLIGIQQQDSISKMWKDASGHNRNRKGFILYDGLGGMGVHHVSENYENYVFEGKGGLDSLTKRDLRHLANNFVYFGRYRVLENDKIIEHHLESSHHPGRWGTTAERRYEFHGDTLKLYPLNTTSGIPARIVWLRLKEGE